MKKKISAGIVLLMIVAIFALVFSGVAMRAQRGMPGSGTIAMDVIYPDGAVYRIDFPGLNIDLSGARPKMHLGLSAGTTFPTCQQVGQGAIRTDGTAGDNLYYCSNVASQTWTKYGSSGDLTNGLALKLAIAQDLADLHSVATARINLGVGITQSVAHGDMTLSARPNAGAFASAAQSIPDTTATVITMDSETWDTGAMHDTGSNTDRLTVPAGGDGTWFCSANVVFAMAATGRRTVQIRKTPIATGTPGAFATGKQLAGDAAVTSSVFASGLTTAVAGDYFNITGQQLSGGALNTAGGAGNTFLSCTKLF